MQDQRKFTIRMNQSCEAVEGNGLQFRASIDVTQDGKSFYGQSVWYAGMSEEQVEMVKLIIEDAMDMEPADLSGQVVLEDVSYDVLLTVQRRLGKVFDKLSALGEEMKGKTREEKHALGRAKLRYMKGKQSNKVKGKDR